MIQISEEMRDRLVSILYAGRQALDNAYLAEEVHECDALIVELGLLDSVTEPARLDPEGTAQPKTRLVGHVNPGDCVGPGIVKCDAIEDVKTGKRTPL